MNVNDDMISAESAGEEIREAVIDAVADATDTDPTALPVLYATLDPEALEQLCRSGDGTVCVEFDYAGCRVVVDGAASVDVTRFDG